MKRKFLCFLLCLAACGTLALGAVGCYKKEVFYFEPEEEQEDEQDDKQEDKQDDKQDDK